jgi:carbamoyl-phosphate synthase large subunit
MSYRMRTILVTGVGAIIGYGIVRSLRASRFPVRIVGMDINTDAVGQRWCDVFEEAVRADQPEYGEHVAGLIRRHFVDLVIPGIEQDVHRLTADRLMAPLAEVNARFALNTPELIRIAGDKWLTHLELEKAGFPTIRTWIDGNFHDLVKRSGCPLLMKPRRSYASKGIQRLATEADYLYWKDKLGDEFMVQEIVGDLQSEYTVGAFGLGDGSLVQQIAFQRVLSSDGSTAKATVRSIPELEMRVEELARQFRPDGPTNFQFRFHRGEYLLLEINPRISSSTSLRAAFGYNEAEMCVEYYLEGVIPQCRTLRAGSAARFIEDWVAYAGDPR